MCAQTYAGTINVPAGGDLQGALTSAQPGDNIILAAGATFTGNFHIINNYVAAAAENIMFGGEVPQKAENVKCFSRGGGRCSRFKVQGLMFRVRDCVKTNGISMKSVP